MPYKNRILFDVELPEPSPSVLVGCFHPLALVGETEIWRKLIRSYDPALQVKTYLVGQWSLSELEGSLAPSVRAQLEVKPDNGWSQLIKPDKPDRTFALVSQDLIANVVVIGTPTEDAWELFESYLDTVETKPD